MSIVSKHKIRDSVIPDIQTKVLRLLLCEEENGICDNKIVKRTNFIEDRTESILKEIVYERIKQAKKGIPLVLRKKIIYEQHINELKIEEETNKLQAVTNSNILPINKRKLLLCKQIRAG